MTRCPAPGKRSWRGLAMIYEAWRLLGSLSPFSFVFPRTLLPTWRLLFRETRRRNGEQRDFDVDSFSFDVDVPWDSFRMLKEFWSYFWRRLLGCYSVLGCFGYICYLLYLLKYNIVTRLLYFLLDVFTIN